MAQIVGHTPRDITDYLPPARFGFEPVWSTDVAGIDDGWVACLVREPGASALPYEAWTPVSIPRPMRPHTDPEHPLLLRPRTHYVRRWSAPYGGYDI